jgi:thiamine pyrophosphokinase
MPNLSSVKIFSNIYMPTLSETFWIAFVATASGFLLKLASMAYKSKCKECYFCGISIKRDVQLELEEHEYDVSNQLNKVKSSTNLDSNENV